MLAPNARVDAPHEPPREAQQAVAEELALVETAIPGEAESEQIRLQAEQLAGCLRGRQKDLDQREAELNSWLACLESEARAARLWIDQRESDLIADGESLAREQQELVARSETMTKTEEEATRRREELTRWELELIEREQELASREIEVKHCLARLAAVEAVADRRNLDDDSQREEDLRLLAERLESHDRELQQAMADLAEERQAIGRRAEHVDQCRAALEPLRAELNRTHRETLELRVATEELWVQLSGDAPPAALIESLAGIRAKLAEQYRQTGADLSRQKNELEAIRGQLAVQHDKLIERKQQFEQWAACHREECEKQTSRLAAREQEVELQAVGLRGQSQGWQAERAGYRRELSRLREMVARRKQ